MKNRNFLFRLWAITIVAIGSCGLAFGQQTHITNRAGLEAIGSGSSGSFILDNDIDLSGSNWTPLGDFKGTLDGNSHVIKGLTISTTADRAAFIKETSGSAVIKNLGFENANIIGDQRVAVVVGLLDGTSTIENCYVANSNITGRWNTGSFAGRVAGAATISNCYSSAVILTPLYTANSGHTGGIVGHLTNGGAKVEKCYFSGIIQRITCDWGDAGQKTEGQVAGIVAWNDNSNAIANNVNLAPYLLCDQGKYRISSNTKNENGKEPSGPNYSLSTTVVGPVESWGSVTPVVSTGDAQYGTTKKHGENIPGGDAKAQSFYETLGWDFTAGTGIWTIDNGNSYPYFSWAENTTSFVVTPVTTITVSENNPVDLSRYIFSGRGRALTFTKAVSSDTRYSLSGSTITLNPPVDVDDEIDVTVQEGALTPTYTLKVTLEATKSKNADLASLTISEGELIPAFDPAVTSYKVLIPSGITSITSTATVADVGLATLTGDGAQDVTAAATQTITVTAEYGNTKNYTINYVLPTYINDRAGLAAITENGDYRLGNDIDLSESNWVPLSNFKGTLDGDGHVIFNLRINDLDAAAFFSTISGNAVVKNLGFENASVTDATHSRTAVLAAFLEGNAVIENCYIANSTISGRWCVGSFVGRARSLMPGGNAAIRNCYSSAYLYIPDNSGTAGQIGGIIGNIYAGDKITVENCYFSGIIQKIQGNNIEGQVAGIAGWIGTDGSQNISGYAIQNNVNLAPYLLSNYGKHRISSTRDDDVSVNDPTPGPNYSLSTTIVSAYNDWGNTTAIVTDGTATNKDGANIPDGDANARTAAFYNTLNWNLTSLWAINEGGSYPYFQWADQTRPHFVVTPAASALSLTSDAPSIDLSKYIFSGRGLNLTFSTTSDKINLSGSTVSIASPITAAETVTVSVQEGSLTPTYSLQITLVGPFVIPANTSVAASTYNPALHTDIIFNEGSQLTGIVGELSVNGLVKVNKTFDKETWYAVGFPFDIASVNCAEYDGNRNLETYKPDGTGSDKGDYWVKTYDGDDTFSDYTSGSETLTAGGYAIQVPIELDGKTLTFTSASSVKLSNSNSFSVTSSGYKLTVNPSVANTAVSSENADKYYILGINAINNFGLLTASNAASRPNIAPFESLIIANNIESGSLKSSVALETPTGVVLPVERDAIISTEYYNLQGVRVGTNNYLPLQSGVYIVKQIYESGKTNVSKSIIR